MNKKQSLAFASTSILAAGMAQGAVVWSGPINTTITDTTQIPVDLNQDTTNDFVCRFDTKNNGTTSLNDRPMVSQAISTNAWVLTKPAGSDGVLFTQFGTMIGDVYAATNAPGTEGFLSQDGNNNNNAGDWPFQAYGEGYVGVEIIVPNTSTNYGWVHLIYHGDLNPRALQLVDYGYETTVGKGIPAGTTNTLMAPIFSQQPQITTIAIGGSGQLISAASGSPNPTYQWQAGTVGSGVYTNLSNGASFSGTTSNILTISSATTDQGLDYVVIASNSQGAATSSPPATVTVQYIPAQLDGVYPQQASVYAGFTVRLTATILSGYAPSLQWRKNGTNLINGGNISGATNIYNGNTGYLWVSNLSSADIGNYDVVLNSTDQSVTSQVSTVSTQLPTGEFDESAVMALKPIFYYRLNETTDPSISGVTAYDFASGLNGTYGNDTQNGNPGNAGILGPELASGYPGFTNNTAVRIIPNDSAGVITLPPWNLNTNTVTFTAWINPQSAQSSGKGIVYTRGTNSMVCGMAYYDGFAPPAGLGFNWNDGAWAVNTHLIPPLNTWSLAAVVISPTNAWVYLLNTNGVQSFSRPGTYPVQSFNTTEWIGTDTSPNNNFDGYIDEVAIFPQALTSQQILTLYAASLNKVSLTPTITSNPNSQQVYLGQTAHFGVTATGNQPLAFQWQAGSGGIYTNMVDGPNISGSTTPWLIVRNLTTNNAINYFVVVTNLGGAVTSSVASVSIVQPTGEAYETYLLGMPGLAAHYLLNELNDPSQGGVTAYDYVGGFNGVYGNAVQNGFDNVLGPQPTDGLLAFNVTNTAIFCEANNATNGRITCPPLNLNTNALTITLWIKPADYQLQWAGLVGWRGQNNMVVSFGYNQATDSNGHICLGYNWHDEGGAYLWGSNLVPPPNEWSLVSLVMDPVAQTATISMRNAEGTVSATNNNSFNSIVLPFDTPMLIGDYTLDTTGNDTFNGVLDDVSIFAATLTPSQLDGIYNLATGRVTLQIVPAGSQVKVTWPFGKLLESVNPNGPWTTNVNTSPYLLSPFAAQKFYRVITQ